MDLRVFASVMTQNIADAVLQLGVAQAGESTTSTLTPTLYGSTTLISMIQLKSPWHHHPCTTPAAMTISRVCRRSSPATPWNTTNQTAILKRIRTAKCIGISDLIGLDWSWIRGSNPIHSRKLRKSDPA